MGGHGKGDRSGEGSCGKADVQGKGKAAAARRTCRARGSSVDHRKPRAPPTCSVCVDVRLSRRVPPFIEYLKENIAVCQASATKSMDIVPFAKVCDCRPADIQDMLGHFRRRLRALGVRAGSMQYKRMVLATSFCVALGWTYAFLEILDIVPVPWTAAYEHALRSRLMGAWAGGAPLFNVHIRQCNALDFTTCGAKKAANQKIGKLLRIMKGIVSRCARDTLGDDRHTFVRGMVCPYVPLHGYTQNCALVLWDALVGEPPSSVECDIECLGAAVFSGLRHVGCDCNGDKGLATLRLQLVARRIRGLWSTTGRRTRMPAFDAKDFLPQLCAWKQDSFGPSPRPLRTVAFGRKRRFSAS